MGRRTKNHCAGKGHQQFSSQSVSQWVHEWVRGLLQYNRCELLLLVAGIWGQGDISGTQRKGMSTVENHYQGATSENMAVDTSVCV
jgi:hypothetical protein